MALTATLEDSQSVDLANNYLRCSYQRKCEKKKTKLNFEKCQKEHRKEGDDMWDDMAKELVNTVQDD